MKTLARAFAASFLLLCTGLVHAQATSQAMLLVAQPHLQGPYAGTALVVVPLGDKHVGFILNRATHTSLASAFPNHGPSKQVSDPIFFGGPEAADALFAVLRRDPGKPSIRLFGDVHMTGNGKAIDKIIEQTPNEARYFAGFVGWLPDELAKEIAAGFWLVGEPDEAQVFRKDTAAMYGELVRRLGKGKAPKQPGDREAQRGTWLAATSR